MCGRSGPDANHAWDLHLKQLLINKQFHLNRGEDTTLHAQLFSLLQIGQIHILYKYAVTLKPISTLMPLKNG